MPPRTRGPRLTKLLTEGNSAATRPIFSLVIENEESGDVDTVVIELLSDIAPKACENFKLICTGAAIGDRKHSKQISYKQCRFLRLTRIGLQTGQVVEGQSIPPIVTFDSELPSPVHHGIGVVSMCRSAAGVDGSQFFICLTNREDDCTALDQRHVAFAKVIEGLDVILRICSKVKEASDENGFIYNSPFVVSEIVQRIPS